MTVAVPTATSMKLKFPEFASQSDTAIEFAIEEAALEVDESWVPAYATLAIMYLAAHHLMVTISREQSGTGQLIKSETMDGMTITYDSSNLRPVAGDYTTTPYGSRYLDLLNKNVPAVLLL